jgi:hypothetical protein
VAIGYEKLVESEGEIVAIGYEKLVEGEGEIVAIGYEKLVEGEGEIVAIGYFLFAFYPRIWVFGGFARQMRYFSSLVVQSLS